MATGKELAKLRTDIGLSQIELAELLKLSPGTLATWERRKERELTGPGNFVYNDLLSKAQQLLVERTKFITSFKR